MTDPITRARKEWCEVRHSPVEADDWYVFPVPCPPEVVAALLDFLWSTQQGIDPQEYRMCGGQAAEAVIARALEQKP